MKPSPLAARLMQLGSLTPRDLRYLHSLELRTQVLPRHAHLLREGRSTEPKAFIIKQGWVLCEKHFADGRVQAIDFAMSSDIIGLGGALFGEEVATAVALSPVRVIPLTQDTLAELSKEHLGLFCALLVQQLLQQQILAEHMLNIGQRSSFERIAHFLLEYLHRTQITGCGPDDSSYHCPATQSQIASLLDLSAVHVNRLLRSLREKGLASFKRGVVRIENKQALAEAAGFNPAFLRQKKPEILLFPLTPVKDALVRCM